MPHGHFVVNSLPFNTHVKHGAKHILAHDRARAGKLLQGLHPHGPSAFNVVEAESAGTEAAKHKPPPTTVPPAGDPTAAGNSIDVTDAG